MFSHTHTDGSNSDVSVATLFPGTATIDGTFTDDMNNPESEAFKNVERNFCEQVRYELFCLNGRTLKLLSQHLNEKFVFRI